MRKYGSQAIKNPPTGAKAYPKIKWGRRKLVLQQPKTNKTHPVKIDDKTTIYVDPSKPIDEQVEAYKLKRAKSSGINEFKTPNFKI